MHTRPESDAAASPAYVSTGRLPFPEQVGTLVAEAYERYQSNGEGQTSQVSPALARVPSELVGSCGVDTQGTV
jgi:glutaminase